MTTFCLDPHVHTIGTSFCGKIKGTVVADLYKKAGYDGIVLTNHYKRKYFEKYPGVSWQEKIDYFLLEYNQAVVQGQKIGLKVLLGMEIQFNNSPCEYLVYGFDEPFLRTYPALYNLGIKGFRKFVDSLNTTYDILIFQAHPFRPGMNPVAPHLLDGVEVHNGNPRHNSHNHLALAFAQINHLKMISGSDFHRLTDLARGGIILSHNIATESDLVGILRENRGINLITSPHLPLCFWRYKLSLRNYLKEWHD